jgi:hypothetical protein
VMRRAQFVLLCEDVQHEAFLRRFLKLRGVQRGAIRVERAPSQRNAEAWVRTQFPGELRAIRATQVNRALVVMTDGDRFGVAERLRLLAKACDQAAPRVLKPTDGDPVAILVPTWNIETWLAYLGGATVSEDIPDYPRLDGRESNCATHVQALYEMCQSKQLREPAPPSLEAACGAVERLSSRLS